MRRSPGFAEAVVALLAGTVVALGCAACGSAARTTSAPPSTSVARATPTSTSSSTPTAATGTGVGTSGATATTTSALPGAGEPVITLGDKNYTEQFVLGQLYAQALRAEGFSVNVNQNIGPTSVTVQALSTGALSIYPEYMDTFNTAIAGYRHGFRTQLDAYQAAQHYAVRHGLQLLAPTPFSDTDAIAVTDAFAAQNHLRSIDDLRRVASTMTLGGPIQFQQGTPGLPALNDVYGVSPALFRATSVGGQYSALNTSSVQAADVNTTDGQLASGDYVLLRDPRRVFGWGNVVPVVSSRALATEGPFFGPTIERVDNYLTTSVMQELNQAVDIAQQDPAVVARQFLETHGLLTPTTF
jgi:osmoprotectant transport system substrate-binding protein